MAEVKLYRVTCTKGYLADEAGSGYSLQPWGKDTAQYEGYDDGGKMYVLPDGYRVAESNAGDMHIYNADDVYCPITSKYSNPAIVDGSNIIMLAQSNWPEIMDSEGITIERGDVLAQDSDYIVADTDTLETIGDGSTWRAIGSLDDGEDLDAALERISKEVSR